MLSNKVIILVATLLWSTPLFACDSHKKTSNNSAVILVYHHIANDTPAITSVSPAMFSQQLDYLAEQGFSVWPLTQLVTAIQRSNPIPDKVVAISFDDAYESVYSQAFPLLKQHGYPFTIFVTTDSVDKQYNKQLNWSQLKEMSQHGATIANHTVNHPHMLRRLEGETDEQWQQRMQQEIIGAQQRIQQKIGSNHKLFAYPYGEHNEALKKIVKDLGYIAFGQQSGAAGPLLDKQLLPRFPVSGNYTDLKDFSLKVHTKALPAEEVDATDNPITAQQAQPFVKLAFSEKVPQKLFTCYGPGGLLPTSWQANTVTINAAQDIPAGRSRYNCTLPAGDGRYYWYSKPWVRLKENGEWILD